MAAAAEGGEGEGGSRSPAAAAAAEANDGKGASAAADAAAAELAELTSEDLAAVDGDAATRAAERAREAELTLVANAKRRVAELVVARRRRSFSERISREHVMNALNAAACMSQLQP